jgi:hypothetical protein
MSVVVIYTHPKPVLDITTYQFRTSSTKLIFEKNPSTMLRHWFVQYVFNRYVCVITNIIHLTHTLEILIDKTIFSAYQPKRVDLSYETNSRSTSFKYLLQPVMWKSHYEI